MCVRAPYWTTQRAFNAYWIHKHVAMHLLMSFNDQGTYFGRIYNALIQLVCLYYLSKAGSMLTLYALYSPFISWFRKKVESLSQHLCKTPVPALYDMLEVMWTLNVILYNLKHFCQSDLYILYIEWKTAVNYLTDGFPALEIEHIFMSGQMTCINS